MNLFFAVFALRQKIETFEDYEQYMDGSVNPQDRYYRNAKFNAVYHTNENHPKTTVTVNNGKTYHQTIESLISNNPMTFLLFALLLYWMTHLS